MIKKGRENPVPVPQKRARFLQIFIAFLVSCFVKKKKIVSQTCTSSKTKESFSGLVVLLMFCHRERHQVHFLQFAI